MKNGKRRGATKVPNVILRPPPSIINTKGAASTSNTQEDNDDSGEIDFREGSLPLRGVNLCATGKLDKVTLFAYAQQLGATRSNDFTDQVTHLIADGPGSPKYQCAVQRNLPILSGNWIEDIYNAWLAGETIDLDQFVAKHRLPIFSGVRLCITGMQDIETRERIATLVEEQGGVYSKSLDHLCTHLLCSDSASNKAAWAMRVNQGRRKKVCIIWEEWFWDCLEFGGRWDEDPYHINMPRPTKKLVAAELQKWKKQATILPLDSLSQVNSLPKSPPPPYSVGDDDTPELGQTQKQKGIGLRILRNIVHTRNVSRNEKEDPQTASVPSVDASALTDTNAGVSSHLQQGRSSVLERLSESRKESLFAVASPSQAIPLSSRCAPEAGADVSATEPISKQPPLSDIAVANIFAGYSFRAFGEAKEGAMLRDAINKHGGRWLSEDDLYIEPDFFLVRLVGGNTFLNEVSSADRSKFRTECWVERSILEERMCAADEHITFTPLNIHIPVEGSEKLFVSLSGLDSAETYWTKRLLRAVGANVQSAFSKSTSHLICPSGRGEKFQKAQEWKIPVVDLEWLFSIAKNGKVPVHRDFEVRNNGSQNIVHEPKDAMFLSETKGDEKAIEVEQREGKIIDITNNHSQEIEPCRPPDPSLRLEETSSVMDCPTVSYQAFIPASPNSTSPFPPTGAEGNMELTFGEPLGVRIPGSPETIEKNSTRGCSMQPSHPSLAQEGSKTCQDVDMKRTQIPSSCSPSPLQINSGSTRTVSPSISETRVLRSTITALLGKRAPEPKSDELTIQKRPTKRPRPHSRSLKESDKVMPSLMSLVATSSPLSCLSNKEDNISNEEESPLGVIYEDPDQRDEKRRLIALFEKSTVISGNADDIIPMQSNVRHPGEILETSKRKKAVRRPNRSSGGKG